MASVNLDDDERRVLAACCTAAGGDLERVRRWYQEEHLREFDGKTAEELVAGGRVDDVLRLIESYEAGPAG